MIVSRFPIVKSTFEPFKTTFKSSSNKGILFAEVEVIPGYFLKLVNVHLLGFTKQYKKEEQILFQDKRNQQIQEIRNFLDI